MSWRLYTGQIVCRVRRAARRVVDELMPRLCVFCGVECAPDEDHICAGCERDLPWLGAHCPRCAEPLPEAPLPAQGCGACQVSPPPFTIVTAPLRYAFPVDAAIRALKFRRRLDYVPAFASILQARFGALPPGIDALLPVPLHWRRQLRRGFNQAAELCAPLAAATGLPTLAGIERVRSTPYQSGLEAVRRRQSLRGAFAVRQPVTSRHVLIIDDVMTTGTTCRELAHAVIGAGALEVSVMALARAGQTGLKT
jgi:ComF family protein